MPDEYVQIKSISRESLEVFAMIAQQARRKLQESTDVSIDPLIICNTMPGARKIGDSDPARDLGAISSSNREGYRILAEEPAIARVVALDEEGRRNIFYISRKSTVPLDGNIKLASYQSAVGRLASLSIGEAVSLHIGGSERNFELIETARYKPNKQDGNWDSKISVFEGDAYGPITVESLLALLRQRGVLDAEAALMELLAGGGDGRIFEGLQHEVRAAMALRDQPILDRIQDEIFRLPINSQLLILGPPGTGKTTTLIRRLGQKLNLDFLEPGERALVSRLATDARPHQRSWLMFTPTDLLKHFVKEAFNQEQVPASDQQIKTWESYRGDIARRVLGVLQSSTATGQFIFKPQLGIVRPEVEENPVAWFEAFQEFHRLRVLSFLQKGTELLQSLRNTEGQLLIDKIEVVMAFAHQAQLMEVFRKLEEFESDLLPFVKSLKDGSDRRIRACLVRNFNADREFLRAFAAFLDTIQMDDESDAEDEFDDDVVEESPVQGTSLQKAEKVYSRALRSLARYKFLKRSASKGSFGQKIRDWLGERIPDDLTLLSIGESIALQNGLRRFINPSRKFVADVPASYRELRKAAWKEDAWYATKLESQKQIGPLELDFGHFPNSRSG